MPLTLERRGDRLVVQVRVVPRASRRAVGGMREGALLVRVTAAPVDGAANEAVLAVLADACGVPRSAARLESGARGRAKRVSLPASTAERLAALAAEPPGTPS